MTRTRTRVVVAILYWLAAFVSFFILSAALVGFWLGLVWRFVWVTAP